VGFGKVLVVRVLVRHGSDLNLKPVYVAFLGKHSKHYR